MSELEDILRNNKLKVRIDRQELQDGSTQNFEQELTRIEQLLGFNLSEEFTAYLRKYGYSSIITEEGFYKPLFNYLNRRKNKEEFCQLDEIYCPATDMYVYPIKLNNQTYACIANVEYDDLLMDKLGQIYFRGRQDNDIADIKKDEMYKVANSWFEFLSMLYSPEANAL